MLYKYRAKKGPQEIVEGTTEAQSEREAIEKINQLGYIPLQVEKGTPFLEPKAALLNKRWRLKLSSRQITLFSRQLSSLLKSGVPILESLNIISEQSESRRLKEILQHLHNAIRNGAAFSTALTEHNQIFSPLYIALVRTGEDAGRLAEALLRIADYRARQEQMYSRFRMALAYPILMLLVGIGTVVFMLTFVMPRLLRIFVSIGQELPLPTRILISLSDGLRYGWFWLVVIIAVIIGIFKRELKTEGGRLSLSIFQLHLPIFGKFILKAELARFSRTMEMLIKNGITILKAIDLAVPVLENEVLKSQLRKSYHQLEQGGSFGYSLKNTKIFPVFMSNLLIVGEKSGKIDEAFAEVANSYERDTDESLRIFASLLEPLLILGMGLVVGFIVMAMLLPIFELNVMMR